MAKEKLNVNSSNKKVKPSLKKLAFWGLLATTLLTWCWDWKKVWNWLDETKSNPIETVEKNKYEWKSIDGVEWMIISENPNTKQLFLSDWKEKLTSDFDNIKNVVKVWEDLYFVWWNWWKYSLYKNWEAILSDFDDIDYRIIDWKIVTITENAWKKTVKRGDEILKENCKEAEFKRIVSTTQYRYDEDWRTVSDCWFAVSCVEEWWNWSTFVNWKLYCSWTWYMWNFGDDCYNWDIWEGVRWLSDCNFFEANWSNIMIISDSRWWNPESWVGTEIVYYNWKPLGRLKWEIMGMQSFIVRKNNWKDVCLSLSTWNILWSEYDEIYAYWCKWHDFEPNGWFAFNQNRLVFAAKKGWKDVLVVNWEDYLVDYSVDNTYFDSYEQGMASCVDGYKYGSNALWFLKKWNKQYYLWNDCMVHEYEWQYDSVIKCWKTSDWKYYFIGKKWNKEYFVFNWEVQWKGYDHISWAWLVEWKHVYVRWERDWEQIFVLNWTERWVDSTTNNSQERKSDLFTR